MNRLDSIALCLLAATLVTACSEKQNTAQQPAAQAAATARSFPELAPLAAASAAETAAYAKLQPLLARNCLMCHSEKPPMSQYRVAPAGVLLETPEQLRAFAPRVLAAVDTTHIMPPQNLTAMNDDDRKQLAAAIQAGWPK